MNQRPSLTHHQSVMADPQKDRYLVSKMISSVGIVNFSFPLTIGFPGQPDQAVTGQFRLHVQLEAEKRGTHMSRFVELLQQRNPIRLDDTAFHELGKNMCLALEAPEGSIECAFSYFIQKKSPITDLPGLVCYPISWLWRGNHRLGQSFQRMNIPALNLCPCSKSIADQNAHCQRAILQVELSWPDAPHQLITDLEDCASAGVYTILKRPDEKWITESSYERPRFVEDCTREMADILEHTYQISQYTVCTINYESIHQHDAYASIVQWSTDHRPDFKLLAI